MKSINKLIAMILVVAIAALTTTACEVKQIGRASCRERV